MLSLGILSLFQRPPNRKHQGSAESRPPRSDYNSQDASSTWECARASGGGVGTSAVELGERRRVDPTTPWKADAGGRAGTGNRAAGSPRRFVKEVGGRSGRQSGKPSPVLSRKAVCGRGQGVAPAMVAEAGEVTAFQPPGLRSPSLRIHSGSEGTLGAASELTGRGSSGGTCWGVARCGGARTPSC